MPIRPAWSGRTHLDERCWEWVVSAAASGVLDQAHWVVLRAELPARSEEYRDLARDLASLAIDGGVLILGAADDDAGSCGTGPQPVAADEALQTITGLITPPLHAIVDASLTHPRDPARTVLVVSVPPSDLAPHQVDGRYWGRHAQGPHVLPDSQVRRLMAARRFDAERLESRLRSLAGALDPVRAADRKNGHVYVLAEPAAGPVHISPLSVLDLAGLGQRVSGEKAHYPPSLRGAAIQRPHPDGHLFTVGGTDCSSSARLDFSEDELVWLLVADDGSVQVVCGAGTRPTRRHFPFSGSDVEQTLRPAWLREFLRDFCMLVADLGEHHLSYSGPWRLGLFIDRLAGVRSIDAVEDFELGLRLEGYPSPEYLHIESCQPDELRQATDAVVRRLTQRLLRGLGVQELHLSSDTRPARDPLLTVPSHSPRRRA